MSPPGPGVPYGVSLRHSSYRSGNSYPYDVSRMIAAQFMFRSTVLVMTAERQRRLGLVRLSGLHQDAPNCGRYGTRELAASAVS